MINQGETPSAEQIRSARLKADMTPEQAAAMIYMKRRTWFHYESGQTIMHPAFWELWQIKVQIKQLENRR